MATYTQENRPLAVRTPLGPDKLLLIGFHGSDALSELFRYRLDLIAENATEVAFDILLGQPCTVTLRWGKDNAKQRFFNGICTRISQGERDTVFTRYHMEIMPKAWLLTRKAQSRIFQRLSVPDILKKVLTGIDVKWNIQGTFQPRDFCVQYRETDFNFACRLMEEEGIFYFFKHDDGNHTMVVGNTPATFEDVPVQNSVPYEEKFGGPRPELRIEAWEKAQQLRSGKYTLWDHCFELPHKHLEAEKIIQDSVSVGSVTHKLKVANNDKLEIYDFPGEYAQRYDGIDKGGGEQPDELKKIFEDNKRTVEIRMQQEAVESLEIEGRSNCRQFVSGHKFALERHFNADGQYVLTGVSHSISAALTDYRTGLGETSPYVNTFRCIPVALPYRPPRVTPKPVVQGTQSAVVVGPPGEEIFTDKYSRVKVQFHWDREGKLDPDSSCWIRVTTLWAGKQWGMIHIPRIGQEVLVDFLEGDPDQPVIVGSVYNADMMPPGSLPGSKTKSGVASRTSLGGALAQENILLFEDKKGEEVVFLHAEKDQRIEVENDESHTVEHDRTKNVNHDETTTIGHDRTENVKHDETIAVGNDRTENVTGNEVITVGTSRVTNIQQDDTLNVFGARFQGVDKAYVMKIGDGFYVDVGNEMTIQVGDSSLTMRKDGTIELAGKDVKILSSNSVAVSGASSVEVTGQKEIKVGVGSQNVTLNQMKVETSGAAISSSAVGTHEISGALIKIN